MMLMKMMKVMVRSRWETAMHHACTAEDALAIGQYAFR